MGRAQLLFLIRGGLVLELLDHGSQLFQRGGVLCADRFRRLATRIGVLHGVEHRARERQRDATMILLADEVEFRPRRFVAFKAIESQVVGHPIVAATILR